MYLARQSSVCNVRLVALKLWENEQQKWATCFAELHKIELKSHVARFIYSQSLSFNKSGRCKLQLNSGTHCHVRSLLQTACVLWKRNLENSFLNHFWSARRITYWGFLSIIMISTFRYFIQCFKLILCIICMLMYVASEKPWLGE